MNDQSKVINAKKIQPKESIIKNIFGLIGAGVGFLVGKYSGLSLIIPLGGAVLFGWLLNKYKKPLCRSMLLPFAIQAGHLFWMFIGVIMLGLDKSMAALFDILIIGLGLYWLMLKPGIWPILYLSAIQLLGFFYNLYLFISAPWGSMENRALLVHLIFRASAIAAMILAYKQFKKEKLETVNQTPV